MPGVKSQCYYVQGLLILFELYPPVLRNDLPELLIGPALKSHRCTSWPSSQDRAPNAVRALVTVSFVRGVNILVEVFINLRGMSPERYDTPTWLGWISHL